MKRFLYSQPDNAPLVGQAVQNMNLMFGIDERAGLNLKASAF